MAISYIASDYETPWADEEMRGLAKIKKAYELSASKKEEEYSERMLKVDLFKNVSKEAQIERMLKVLGQNDENIPEVISDKDRYKEMKDYGSW